MQRELLLFCETSAELDPCRLFNCSAEESVSNSNQKPLRLRRVERDCQLRVGRGPQFGRAGGGAGERSQAKPASDERARGRAGPRRDIDKRGGEIIGNIFVGRHLVIEHQGGEESSHRP